MKLWSRGLGTTEITMDFREYKIEKEPGTDNVIVFGTMKDPVNWEFKITMTPEDIPGFIKMLMNISVLRLGLNNAHKYFSYLWNRKRFEDPEGGNLAEKVNSAYESMMHRQRRRAA
jgi:hypothetical protein